MKIIVIGGGVVGCAVARELSALKADITLLERGNDVAVGASKANSGIVHAGFDAKPGTNKARFNVEGARLLPIMAKELDFPYKNNGALVLNFSEDGNDKLQALYEQGLANGVKELKIISGDEVRKLEPSVSDKVTSALYVPTSGIVGPYEMAIAYAENASTNGVEFVFNKTVKGVVKTSDGFKVETDDGDFFADIVINCAGVYSDEINNSINEKKDEIVARKGEYMLLDKSYGGLTYATLFQLPTEMGKGVLVSPTAHGNIIVGPTAEDIDDKDCVDTTAYGLEKAFNQASLSVPSLNKKMIITQFSGLRAHSTTGDFTVGRSETAGFYNCMGVESPGLTSAPAIGKYIASLVKEDYALEANENFNPKRKGIKRFFEMTDSERAEAIKANPLYGKVVCRCEVVTEGEIVEAIHRRPGAVDLDGLKRRTRAGMGRCQAGFCTPRLMEILSRELKIEMTAVTKKGKGSELLTGKVKE